MIARMNAPAGYQRNTIYIADIRAVLSRNTLK